MKYWLILLLIPLMIGTAAADTMTVNTYVTNQGFRQMTQNFTMVAARYEMPAPGWIQEIRINAGGSAGSFELRIFGHEGGIPWPEAQEDLITTVTINKPNIGGGWLTYTLPNPIWIGDDQFFIGLQNFSAGTFPREDRLDRNPLCVSPLGGDVWPTYWLNGSGNWVVDSNAVLMDVLLDIPDQTPANHFTDVTTTLGINTNFGQSRLSAADYNDDGWVDLLINGQLYTNDINNTGQFLYETNTKGISPNAQAHAFVDSDNDGDLDILALQLGDNTSKLYTNDGAGNFTSNTLTNFPSFPAINTVSIADINGDDLPDIHVGQLWVNYPDDLPKYLFINDGNNGWTDNSSTLYADTFYGVSRGSQFTDYDNDGDQDLFVANYVTAIGRTESPRDELWQNDGNGQFTNVIGNTVIDDNNGSLFWNYSTGCAWEDYDNDGDMDLLSATLSHPRNMTGANGEFTEATTIYSNNGAPNYQFTDEENTHGFHFEETQSGGVMGDVNNDGLLDAFFTAFYECRFADLYIQQPDNSFALESFDWGVDDLDTEQDAIFLDYDNDGDLDLLAGQDKKVRLFRNDFTGGGNYIKIKAVSNTKNIFALGAKIHVYADGNKFTREVVVGQGQRMQKPYEQHFGLGNASSIDSVVIQWPGDVNHRNRYTGLSVNQSYTLEEFIDSTTSLDELTPFTEANIYPNPTKDQLFIQLPEFNRQLNISIVDPFGRIVLSNTVDRHLSESIYQVMFGELSAGNYFVHITDASNGGSRYLPLIVVK